MDLTGEFFVDGNTDSPLGKGSHYHFFTADLEPLGEMILIPPEYPAHYPEVSMIKEPGRDILMFHPVRRMRLPFFPPFLYTELTAGFVPGKAIASVSESIRKLPGRTEPWPLVPKFEKDEYEATR